MTPPITLSHADAPMELGPVAQFAERTTCISCHSPRLRVVAQGSADDEPLRSFLASDPWGESPMGALAGSQWRLMECAVCRTRFHGNILDPLWRAHGLDVWMSDGALLEFERRLGRDSFDYTFANASRWLGHFLSIECMTRAGRGDGLRILDFGCGSGQFLAQAAQFGSDSYGIDASAARRGFATYPGVTIVAEFADLPADMRFDAVTLFEVLEHLDDPLAVLQEARGRLRLGGVLVLETPNAGNISCLETIADYRAIHPFDHINAFSPASLTLIAEQAGFKRVAREHGFVSSGPMQTLKGEARRVLAWMKRPVTQQYFRAH